MKTKLETMVGYLAGRQGDAVERVRLELEDPGSDASRWLAEVRSRSRALFSPGSLEQPPGGRSPAIPTFTAEPRPSRSWWLPPFVLGAIGRRACAAGRGSVLAGARRPARSS